MKDKNLVVLNKLNMLYLVQNVHHMQIILNSKTICSTDGKRKSDSTTSFCPILYCSSIGHVYNIYIDMLDMHLGTAQKTNQTLLSFSIKRINTKCYSTSLF